MPKFCQRSHQPVWSAAVGLRYSVAPGRDRADAVDIKAHISDLLTPLGKGGQYRSLTWNDLRGASLDLAREFGVPEDLWIPTPCAIETISW